MKIKNARKELTTMLKRWRDTYRLMIIGDVVKVNDLYLWKRYGDNHYIASVWDRPPHEKEAICHFQAPIFEVGEYE